MRISNYPLATNLSGTDKLLGTKAGKTRNFSLDDIVDYAGTILTISAGDITSESIDLGLTYGNLPWSRLSNVPFATSSVDGILTKEDYILFLSGTNNSIGNTNNTLNYNNGISGTNTQLSANPTIGLVSIIIPNTNTKLTYDSFGRIISATNITSADIPTLPASRIVEDSNDRFVSDSQISYWNSLSATSYPVSSIDISETIGNLQWNRLNSIPVATTNTYGVLTSSDWNIFNNKPNVSSLNNYLPLSGGNITGSISAVGFVDTNFIGGRVLLSNGQAINESSITNTELSYLSNVSANIQTQIDQLHQNSLSGTGAGTVGKIGKFVTSSSVGDSSISDLGSLVTFSTPITINGDISATTFTGLASRATSALQADTLKTNRTFSISGDVFSNVVSFNGTGNVVLSGTISNISPTKIAQDINNRFVTDTQITSWNNAASATINVSAIDISLTSGSLNWNRIINEPTTLSGYGISSTDSLFDTKYSPVTTNTTVQATTEMCYWAM